MLPAALQSLFSVNRKSPAPDPGGTTTTDAGFNPPKERKKFGGRYFLHIFEVIEGNDIEMMNMYFFSYFFVFKKVGG